MKINLISHDNGVGLTQDVAIVKQVLDQAGHECTFFEIKRRYQAPEADINIFFELLNPWLTKAARVNLYFPNPEWFWFRKELQHIDLVLCKTRDAERLFNKLGCKTIYTSFTSRDMNQGIPPKAKRREYLHLAGQSDTKGSEATWTAWAMNKQFPPLYFFKSKNNDTYLGRWHDPNIVPCLVRVDEDLLRATLNGCLFHVCASAYEGFGHYIWEAKSCGGIVLTTDAHPMKDFVTDGVDGFLVPPAYWGRQQLATTAKISPLGLSKIINRTLGLTGAQLATMSRASRKSWEANDRYFRGILPQIINNYQNP